MRKQKIILGGGLYGLLLAAAISLLFHLHSYYLQLAVIASGLSLGMALAYWNTAVGRKARRAILWSAALLLVLTVTAISSWTSLNACRIPDMATRNPGISGKVLVLAPHQDDELNLVGGAFETILPDCDIHVLYSTNGEQARVQEAKNALDVFGVDAQHIAFLGYDRVAWKSALQHMYNAPRDKVTVSEEYGRSATRNTPYTPCYREGRDFTQANFEDDLQDYLAHLRPDVVIVTDFDVHPDHRALGLSTERVLARMMKADPTYRPTVLKSFAYSCSWLQRPDFYAENLKSTQYLGKDGCMEEVNCHRWDERLRIPVGKSSISRTLVGNLTARAFNEHISQQQANTQTNEKICNGDKVFWWRPTLNLMWDAHITADSGDAAQLSDFLLYDSDNVSDFEHMPYEHGWRPSGGKGEATVTWDSPVVVREIHLFDQNNPANQVKHLTIRLSNGREIAVGALPAGGTRVVVPTQCDEAITGFTVHIDDSTGEGSGLAEVEAYTAAPEHPFQVAKLQDANGDFMYDYTTRADGGLAFSLYTWGCDTSRLNVQLAEGACNGATLRKTEHGYNLQVPQGESCVLEVRDAYGNMLDAARVCNPGQITRTCHRAMRCIDPIMVYLSWENQERYYKTVVSWLSSKL